MTITRDGLTLGSFDGLTLTLKNGNDDVPFTASCPYLVLPENHGLNADDTLTLTVTPDASMQLTGGTDTSTLQNGSFTVALKSWGKAAVTATSTPAAPCVVILFDGDNAVSSGTTSNGVFTSDPLPAGTYTAVAYETNDYFGAVGSKTALSALGLTAGDYAEGSVTIADEKTAALTLPVPKLNTANLTSILDTDQCSLVFRSNRAVTDHPFDMQVNYALKPGYTAEKITFTLPSGVSIQSVYNERGELTVDGTNSVTVNNASDTLYVSLKCTDTGVKSIGASITTTGGTTLPLGSGTVTVQKIFLDAAESYTAKRTGNRAEVFTTPNTPVSMTISGVETPVAGITNAAGRLPLTYGLPEKATHGQSYALIAEANGGSARTSVTYFPAKAKLQWFGFRHYGYDITIIDNLYPDK